MKVLKDVVIGIIVIVIAIVITFILRTYFFSFDKKLTNEQKVIIEQYISDKSKSYIEESMTFMSTHYFGSRFNDDKLKVYLWVRFSEYDTKDGKFEEYSSYSVPHVITINMSDDFFEIIGIEIPKDGAEYKKSIKSMFPITIRSKVLMFEKTKEAKKLSDEHQELIQVYKDYSIGE